ncbi:MAG: hypothetical protein HXX12_09815 [Geothrix sp.]|uniref:hypothetical protein n=1 Tax=Geothrix sp. TaxID=1962974 RepID=UPI001824F1CE|nr:hypothetical protein [Geothrix sp.]NWJ41254.1 hypothetical protein [Geothrix sp.]WIL20755.1 MAG: hypothetical protein QOZ81_003341 [Geothrix sp.]
MLTEVFSLVLQLPPLAFGPARVPEAFAPPRALACEVRQLGQVQVPERPLRPIASGSSLDPRDLRPAPERYLVNRPVDILLLLATAYSGRATWDETPWSVRTWQATGAAAPVLIPPQPPPFLAPQRW